MFRKNEMVIALEWLLDLFDLDEYKNEEGESVDVNDYYLPDIAMVLRDKAETVYQYRMDTDYPKGVNYRGKELFREAAILMCSENESTTFHDNIRICYDNELWMLEDGTFAVVHCLNTQHDDDVVYNTAYRSLVGIIETEEDLFCGIEDILKVFDQAQEKIWECEAAIYEL